MGSVQCPEILTHLLLTRGLVGAGGLAADGVEGGQFPEESESERKRSFIIGRVVRAKA